MKNVNENSRGVKGDVPLTLKTTRRGDLNKVVKVLSKRNPSTPFNGVHNDFRKFTSQNPRQSSKIIKSLFAKDSQWNFHFVWSRGEIFFYLFRSRVQILWALNFILACRKNRITLKCMSSNMCKQEERRRKVSLCRNTLAIKSVFPFSSTCSTFVLRKHIWELIRTKRIMKKCLFHSWVLSLKFETE